MIRSYLMLMLFSLLLSSCISTRKEINVVYFSTHVAEEEFDKIGSLTDGSEWNLIKAENRSIFSEDSLKDVSAIVIRISDINKLDHRAVPQLKRYLEAGGGGIVAVRDTLLDEKGWPWLKIWLEKENNKKIEQDQGRLATLEADYTTDEFNEALKFVIGKNHVPNFSKTSTLGVPDSSRYTREVLVESLDEPLQMAILPNEDVLFVERKGGVKLYENISKQTKTIANINVFSGIEDGLLGVAADPEFEKNHWIYLYYAAVEETAVNRLSRFELYGDSLVLGSEKVILEIPTQRIYCCHSAGYLSFDKEGILYLSTGDNTNAEETEGYTPVDERPGRSLADDQATAANTNDLRGKILRIKPLPAGGYEIPDGNLFSKDGSAGRPEIYTMGSRNPFRYSIDSKNNYLYFGDVGPDTKVKASTGEFMSFDEINQVREPGFYGWPYFLGNNEIFPKYNYATKAEDPGKDPTKPINSSPNNTGARELPPAKPAMIWYAKGNSAKFPLVGSGGASAMAGPVFNKDYFKESPYRLSDYYDGKLLIFEWIRGWIMAITFDENGNYLRMEPFLDHLKFEAPVDVQFATDGSLYVLEYGTNWFSKNTNAKLVRIRYVEGNRNPEAIIEIDKHYGAAPMKVELSANNSNDHDQEDVLSFEWTIENKKIEGENIAYTFNKPGTYEVILSAKDNKGGVGKTTSKVFVGNTPPEVAISTKANSSFYWDNVELDYDIKVTDKEETTDPGRLNISFGYIPRGKDAATILTGNQEVSSFKYLKGKQLLASLDCKSCHSLDQASVGPTYTAIAARYSGKRGAEDQLSEKVINGGSGNWGERAMSPHPAISKQEAEEMVGYILSLKDGHSTLPMKDVILLKDHVGKGNEGAYLLNATYKDQGANGIGELQSRDYILLKNPVVQAEDFDEGNVRISTITTAFMSYIYANNSKYIKFNGIDLTHVKGLSYRVQQNGIGGNIELHLDKTDGPLVSSIAIPAAKSKIDSKNWKEFSTKINATQGKHDLFFVFTGEDQHYFNMDWILFLNK